MTAHELANMLLQMPDVPVQIAVPYGKGIMQPLTGMQIVASPTGCHWEPPKQDVLVYGAYYNFMPKADS
jgi:hypothetical protein